MYNGIKFVSVGDGKESSGGKASSTTKDTKRGESTPTTSQSGTAGLKVKSKFADLKRKFKSDSMTDEKESGAMCNAESDEEHGDFVEIAEEAGKYGKIGKAPGHNGLSSNFIF